MASNQPSANINTNESFQIVYVETYSDVETINIDEEYDKYNELAEKNHQKGTTWFRNRVHKIFKN
ncbi:uncharacterized protein ASCRUDRAFT_76191 [Ascoidea rubescens DSM 1968]|uniref:Uncharacterized protein n=1 Tax=Ascoidea rubescens DSM 1968 TaxID=1344418 RepID=A0A1D2VGR3_9ASCO|nr:hypothetical protein ASCRUDRAFT_76191 [Ascoidea rubescens DSM 1968]ODV60826.1 hypothetical protein ASCRUDRAFT_76191 [Ascoidea rubescens DSM 1968]